LLVGIPAELSRKAGGIDDAMDSAMQRRHSPLGTVLLPATDAAA